MLTEKSLIIGKEEEELDEVKLRKAVSEGQKINFDQPAQPTWQRTLRKRNQKKVDTERDKKVSKKNKKVGHEVSESEDLSSVLSEGNEIIRVKS